MTMDQALRWARQRLDGVDAEALLGAAAGETSAGLIAGGGRRLSAAQIEVFTDWVERRAGGEPVAYLIGQREFWSLAFAVTPAVLIPRPESELLVELAVARARSGCDSVLELGTGCGAIALAVASEVPQCAIIATDICPAALAVAKRNRRAVARQRWLDLSHVDFRLSDWFAALPPQRFALIVANPPYIAPDDPHLRAGDLIFEPISALISPPDGLSALTAIIAAAPRYLAAAGMLALEHGHDQAAAVRALFARHGFTAIATHRDLAGCERVTCGVAAAD